MAEYTEQELKDLLQREGDKRVTEALATAKVKWTAEQSTTLETEKARWQTEFEQNAKMTAEELAKKQFEEREAGVLARERELQKKSNLITAKETLAGAGIPKEESEKMLGILVTDDAETTTTNIGQFVDMYTAVKTSLETKIKADITKIPPPPAGGGGELTQEQFMKMGYAEMQKLKGENPELYYKFMK